MADGNHVLLTGQRRMGKTSLARELGRRLECDGWLFFYVDLEGAIHPEDVVALLAQQLHPVQSLTSRLTQAMGRLIRNVEEISAYEFRLRVRAELDAGNWRRHGEALFEACATEPRPVLVVLDELPIFLLAMLQREGRDAVDDFLTWLRAVQQNVAGRGLVFIASGSIGLVPLHDPARHSRSHQPPRTVPAAALAPRHLHRMLRTPCQRLRAAIGRGALPEAVYGKLGLGIPHHVQSFFAHLRDDAIIGGRTTLNVDAVDRVYRESLLGPWGQTDLMHYDTRLKDALDDRSHRIALELLTESGDPRDPDLCRTRSPRGKPSCPGRRRLKVASQAYSTCWSTTAIWFSAEHGHVFQSRLLKDWWLARFGRGHEPLEQRTTAGRGEHT